MYAKRKQILTFHCRSWPGALSLSLPASRSRSSPRSAYDSLRGRSEPRVVEPESGVCGLAAEELAYDSCVNAADRDDDVCVGVTSGYG